MISRRLIVNLIAFFVVSFALVGYGVVNLLGNPLQSPTVLTTDFPDASGLYPSFAVELNGVPGRHGQRRPSSPRTATQITMSIHPGTKVPDDVQSSIQIANDLGEQVVDLVPDPWRRRRRTGRAAPTCRRRPTRCPANVGQVVDAATRLLRAIPGGDLNKLIGDLATSLPGQAGICAPSSPPAPPSRRSSSPTRSSSPSSWPMRPRPSMR